jgi:hypothetical protein
MNDLLRRPQRPPAACARLRRATAAGLLALALLAPPAPAGQPVPVHARAGLELARDAAMIWSPDAHLIYLENDEALDTHGASLRWGYLFYSPALRKARVYSIRGGRIVVAEDLAMKFEAPPVAGEWIDSEAAFRVAADGPARSYCFEHDGRLETMLLLRGAIQEDQPDRTTWMLVYTAPNLPGLFVILDASDGKVLRTWRG